MINQLHLFICVAIDIGRIKTLYGFLKEIMNFKNGTEAREQQQLCNWLIGNNYKYTAIINDMYTTSFKQKAKAKAIGLHPGMSDLIIILKRGNVLFLEMKKKKGKRGGNNGSVVSEYQLSRQKAINKCEGVEYCIGYGYEYSINLITQLECKN